jgi:hypothetical protein
VTNYPESGVGALKCWENDGQPKLALGVHSLAELETLKQECEAKLDCPRDHLGFGTSRASGGHSHGARHRPSGRQSC